MVATVIYSLSLHDALPILNPSGQALMGQGLRNLLAGESLHYLGGVAPSGQMIDPTFRRLKLQMLNQLTPQRSEEHTSELQSHSDLVCRLLLAKKMIVDYLA